MFKQVHAYNLFRSLQPPTRLLYLCLETGNQCMKLIISAKCSNVSLLLILGDGRLAARLRLVFLM